MDKETKKWHVCICQKGDKKGSDYDIGILLGLISGACDIDAEVWYNPIMPISVVKRYGPTLLQSPLYLYHRELVGIILRDEKYRQYYTPVIFQCTDDQFDEIKLKTEKYMTKALTFLPEFIWE